MCWLSVFENVPASKPSVISCVIYEVLLLSVSSLADSFHQKKKSIPIDFNGLQSQQKVKD